MADTDISPEVQSFIKEHIRSIEQLEVLLLLQRDPARSWTAEELSNALYISVEAAAHRLNDFCTRGFCITEAEPAQHYRYHPGIGHLDSVIRDLRIEYEQRRVRVINLIFANPNDQLRSFSDAFKFRKDEE